MPQKRRKELPEENQTLSRPPRRFFDARRAAGEEVTPIDRGNIYTVELRSFQRNGFRWMLEFFPSAAVTVAFRETPGTEKLKKNGIALAEAKVQAAYQRLQRKALQNIIDKFLP